MTEVRADYAPAIARVDPVLEGCLCSSIEEWAAEVYLTFDAIHRNVWRLADLLVWGEAAYGEAAWQYIADLPLAQGYVNNLRWVARAFPPSRRRELPNLPLAYFQEVRPLPEPEQEAWLRRAADEGWKRAELRQAMKGAGLKPPRDTLDLALEVDVLTAENAALRRTNGRQLQELEETRTCLETEIGARCADDPRAPTGEKTLVCPACGSILCWQGGALEVSS